MAFNKIIGNEEQKEVLTNTLKEGRLSHSYIFSGPSGIGKKLFAIEFAKLINCSEDSLNDDRECKCISCSKIEKSIHPDVSLLEYEGEKTIKIDQVRADIEQKIYLSPFEGKYKIFIVDDAERMNLNAQNAFLKTLEEPPPYSVIILITGSLNFIIPTIKSRCQINSFNTIDPVLVKNMLTQNTGMEMEHIETAARLSRGSIGTALNLGEEEIEFRKQVTKRLLSLRPDSPSAIFELYEFINLDSKGKNPEHLKTVYGIISDWLTDLIHLKIRYKNSELINTEFQDQLSNYAGGESLEGLLDKADYLDKSWYGVSVLNANKKLAFEDLMIKLSA